MTRVEIDYTKSLEENADDYYAKAKKAKKKLAGLARGMDEVKAKLSSKSSEKTVSKKLVKKRDRKWFEKFHWFFTSEGFLAVAGRDARSNEEVVKKIMEPKDVYFHADIQGAPHTVLKTGGKKPSKKSLEETAVFAAVFSKAWREQLPAIDVYSAEPSQVSKKAPSGESLGTGAFMVYGQRGWFKKTPLEFAVGFTKECGLVSGPEQAVKKNASHYEKISFGNDSKGACSKNLRKIFREKGGCDFSLDDISALLPSGGLGISKK